MNLPRNHFIVKTASVIFALLLFIIIGLFPLTLYKTHAFAADNVTFTNFPLSNDLSSAGAITKGPDGNLWFTDSGINDIGNITTNGTITEFPIGKTGNGPDSITAGSDGNLWFTEDTTNQIGRMTTSGTVTEFPLSTYGGPAGSITNGPDGNLWFTRGNDTDKIGKITPSGTVTMYPLPTDRNYGFPLSITSGPDGNLWFTTFDTNYIGRITPNGVVTMFSVTMTPADGVLGEITSSPDGNLWFTVQSPVWTSGPDDGKDGLHLEPGAIGKITTSGVSTIYSIPTANYVPYNITAGPDGNIWFTENNTAVNNDGFILTGGVGRITPQGVITEFLVPNNNDIFAATIASGSDGNVWFTAYNSIYRVNIKNIVTFDSVLGDITTLKNDKAVNIGIADGLTNLVSQSKQQYQSGRKNIALLLLNNAINLLNIGSKFQFLVASQAYQILSLDFKNLETLITTNQI